MNSKHTPTPYPAHVVTQKFGPDASMLHGLLPVVRIAPQIDVVVVSLGATPKETGLMAEQIAREHNAHDDLVAALKAVDWYLLKGGDALKVSGIVSAALAKAEGGAA